MRILLTRCWCITGLALLLGASAGVRAAGPEPAPPEVASLSRQWLRSAPDLQAQATPAEGERSLKQLIASLDAPGVSLAVDPALGHRGVISFARDVRLGVWMAAVAEALDLIWTRAPEDSLQRGRSSYRLVESREQRERREAQVREARRRTTAETEARRRSLALELNRIAKDDADGIYGGLIRDLSPEAREALISAGLDAPFIIAADNNNHMAGSVAGLRPLESLPPQLNNNIRGLLDRLRAANGAAPSPSGVLDGWRIGLAGQSGYIGATLVSPDGEIWVAPSGHQDRGQTRIPSSDSYHPPAERKHFHSQDGMSPLLGKRIDWQPGELSLDSSLRLVAAQTGAPVVSDAFVRHEKGGNPLGLLTARQQWDVVDALEQIGVCWHRSLILQDGVLRVRSLQRGQDFAVEPPPGLLASFTTNMEALSVDDWLALSGSTDRQLELMALTRSHRIPPKLRNAARLAREQGTILKFWSSLGGSEREKAEAGGLDYAAMAPRTRARFAQVVQRVILRPAGPAGTAAGFSAIREPDRRRLRLRVAAPVFGGGMGAIEWVLPVRDPE